MPVMRHGVYFLFEGDIIIRVEDSIFRVHRYFLTRESTHFRSLFSSSYRDPPGTTEANPVVLEDATSEAFADFLWVFYNPEYSIYIATPEKWQRILALAQKWKFIQVEKLCERELEKLTIPPVDKIKIYQDFGLNPELLYDSYAELITRREPLELDEGEKLELITSLKISRARELRLARALGPDGVTSLFGPAALQSQEPEIQSVIKDVFGLQGPAPAPTSSPPQPTATAEQNPASDVHVDEVPQTRRQNRRGGRSSDMR
ncbi:hypothetical protein EDB85DRAFT_2271580 [Lactarius pseudohatsudake]|nr:hypothetical protein EDB85DRAFT_2271580 [Lactarius pseudohatsudake]